MDKPRPSTSKSRSKPLSEKELLEIINDSDSGGFEVDELDSFGENETGEQELETAALFPRRCRDRQKFRLENASHHS